MADIHPTIREILACPSCQGPLRDEPAGSPGALVCDACALRYPVEEGIPVLLIERATGLTS
ncbi:MAG: Trm112 family protein [Gemmatimonadaceae bacterium]|nr:Trm112 family protein [Gemmatimonadaceae bacterium]